MHGIYTCSVEKQLKRLFVYKIEDGQNCSFYFEKLSELKEIKIPVLSGGILVWILYPAIIVDTAGVFRLPYAKFISLVFGN
jgi:hypothetical protein